MGSLDYEKERISVSLSNDEIIGVDVEARGVGRQDVGSVVSKLQFKGVRQALRAIIREIAEPIQDSKPSKATVKFGLELGVQNGSLITAVTKGSGQANFEITLEWTNKDLDDIS